MRPTKLASGPGRRNVRRDLLDGADRGNANGGRDRTWCASIPVRSQVEFVLGFDRECGSWADIDGMQTEVCFVPCVDGSGLARTFFTFAALVGAAMCSAFKCGTRGRWP